MCASHHHPHGTSPRGRNYAGPFRKTPDRLLGMGLIRAYQLTLSSVIGSSCRHSPTCSEYGYEAIARHGLWSGGWLTLFRVGRCGPGGTWGFDPVPEVLDAGYRWWAPWRYWRAGRKTGDIWLNEQRTSFDPVTRVEAYHAAINALDFAAIETFFAEHAVYLSPGTGDTVGRDAILSAFRHYFETYPDQRAWDDSIEATGPREARAIWNIEATHATTGERISRRGIETVEFDSEGRIVRIEVEDL